MTNLVLTLILFVVPSFGLSSNNNNIYIYDEEVFTVNDEYYSETNDTDDYDESFEGRSDQLLGETRPPYQIGHFLHPQGSTQLQDLSSLLNFNNIHRPFGGINKHKRRKIIKKSHKYLLPLLLTALAKVAHFLPVVKLTLLALFALVLFSKKALLVSLGSLVLVIYDSFYKGKQQHIGVNIVKDRGSTIPTVEHTILSEEHRADIPEEAPWGREESTPPKINPREGIEKPDNWKRWWAPQIKHKRKPMPGRRLNEDALLTKFEDIIYEI